MLSRIKDDLNVFLKQYDLEINSRIFEHAIPFLANLDISEPQMTCFHFTKKLNDVGCKFSTPKFDENNKLKLLHFCGMQGIVTSEENDEEDMFEITESHLESIVIPAFKNFVSTLDTTHPDLLIYHQFKSRDIFEQDALYQIKKYIHPLLDELESNTVLTTSECSIKTLLSNLMEMIKSLKGYHAYLDYVSLEKVLNDFRYTQIELDKVLLQNATKYSHAIGLIIDNLKIYLRVNPIKEYLKWIAIRRDLNDFLHDSKISIYECDIFENTLLKIAGISNYGSQCKFDMDYQNQSCMRIYIPELSLEDAEKFLKFFHQNGATTAKITSSCYEEGEVSSLMRDEYGRIFFYAPSPGVYYRIDFMDIKNNILPLFYEKINEMKESNPTLLEPYQKKSERRFKEKLTANTKKSTNEIEKSSSTSEIYQVLHHSPEPAINIPSSEHALSKPEQIAKLVSDSQTTIPVSTNEAFEENDETYQPNTSILKR